MLTKKFKVLVGVAALSVAGVILSVNQWVLQNEVKLLQEGQRLQPTRVEVVTPTSTPTATPTATIKFAPKVVVPTK